MPRPDTLYFITGPTASGKTAVALEWAAARGCEILSCDALCVYRGMDIGTAKPTAAEQARIPHHGLDLVPPAQVYSVGEYAAYASRIVAAIRGRGRGVVVVGGSGFYLQSFFTAVTDRWPVTAPLRAHLAALHQAGGLAAWVAELRRRNPEGLGTLDLRNPRRVGNALARCLASGRSLACLQAEFSRQPEPFAGWRKHVVLLRRSQSDLHARIERRTRTMLAAGLVDEVRRLRQQGIEGNPSAARAIGYRETLAWLDQGTGEDDLAAAITLHTRQLARRQLQWFGRRIPVTESIDLSAAPVDISLANNEPK
jgi:tRNA dimethylallyltransferase